MFRCNQVNTKGRCKTSLRCSQIPIEHLEERAALDYCTSARLERM